jgi:hypothetical protein
MTELVRITSETEVVQYWLQREYKYRREVKVFIDMRFKTDNDLITNKDYSDRANDVRLCMLLHIRPFLRF